MFIKRLGYFMIGLSIGVIFLTFFLKKKSEDSGVSFCYLPNCRVLKDLRSKPFEFSNNFSELIKNKEIDSLTITSFFSDGDIDFGRSNTKSKPCRIYFIEKEIDAKTITIEVKNCPKKVSVIGLH